MKTFKLIGFALVAMLFSPVLTSCGDDDDDDNDQGGGNPPAETLDGKYLKSVNNLVFSYDSKGRCNALSQGGSLLVDINYSKGILTFYDGNDPDGSLNIKFNKSGYVTEISGSTTEKEDGVTFKGSGKYSFSYNNGYLVSVTATTKETASGGGESYSYSDSYKETYKWVDGNLTESKCTYEENDNGEKSSGYYNSTITYGSVVNKYRQYTLGLSKEVLVQSADDSMGIFALVGMLGKGTTNFPSVISESFDEDGHTGSSTYNCSITLNTDETIASESINSYNTYIFSYETPRAAMVDFGNNFRLNPGKLFLHKKHSNK